MRAASITARQPNHHVCPFPFAPDQVKRVAMRLILLLSLSLTLVSTALAPRAYATETASRAQLDGLRKQMRSVEQSINADLGQRAKEQAALQKVERQISQLAREARTLEQDQAKAAKRLITLRDEQVSMANERIKQVSWLARTARASYMNGRQETLKLLLNQEQPDRLARLLRYQDYFQSARAERVVMLNKDLAALLALAERVEQARNDVLKRQDAVNAQQTRLNNARGERATTLASLNKQLDSNTHRLEQMRGDEKRIESLLKQMQQTLNDIPANPSGAPFGKLANKLPWPVTRDLRARFGTVREGPVRWNGVILRVVPGEPVRAIHSGRVVYSDWLRGYGLLTIIDHGRGYLTLYGYNESLMREVGEWVSTGDTIALAGNSRGTEQAGLYFEIRRDGKPVNPDRWCNSRVTLPQ